MATEANTSDRRPYLPAGEAPAARAGACPGPAAGPGGRQLVGRGAHPQPPCLRCGTTGPKACRERGRVDGTALGFAGAICVRCFRQLKDIPAVPPCASCGTRGGYRGPNKPGPERHRGEPHGVAGPVCRRCKRSLQAREAAAERERARKLRHAPEAAAKEACRAPTGDDPAEVAERIVRVRLAKRRKYRRSGREGLTLRELDRVLPRRGEARA